MRNTSRPKQVNSEATIAGRNACPPMHRKPKEQRLNVREHHTHHPLGSRADSRRAEEEQRLGEAPVTTI